MREKSITAAYISFQNNIPSIAEHIREHILKQRPWCVVLNDFPYYLEPGIRHFTLWSQKPLYDFAIADILLHVFGSEEVIWFVNLPKYQSIPEVVHYHVFVMSRCEGEKGAPLVDELGDSRWTTLFPSS